jgi:acyl-coenzyme A thioesterase PaaI-like protein
MLATIGMDIHYLEPVVEQDAIAEGWVTKRGRSTVFCAAEVRTDAGDLAATASLIYKVSQDRTVAR